MQAIANKSNNHCYNKSLQPLARQLRNNASKSEACLWKYVLRGRGMYGFQFRRQRPVLNFIADFMSKELMLIIELDGITHQWEGAIEKDKYREEQLKRIGFRILRFDDAVVLNDIENVRRTIETFVLEQQAILSTP